MKDNHLTRTKTARPVIAGLLLSCAVPAHALYTFNFEQTAGADIVAGQVIGDSDGNTFSILGTSATVEISTHNNSGPDLGVAFDPDNVTGGDTDLGSPFKDQFLINSSGGGDGDRVGATGAVEAELTNPAGNLLIIQERDTGAGCSADGFCLSGGTLVDPDDDTQGGYHTLSFSSPQKLLSIDIFDLDGGRQDESATIALFADAAMTTLLWDLQIGSFGNHDAARVLFGDSGAGVSDVAVAKLSLSSSGAFSNLRGTTPGVPEPGSLGLVALGVVAMRYRYRAERQLRLTL
jgi:hypothetical protein